MQQHLRALTIGSANHLRAHGFITPQHHAQIVASVTHGAAAANEMQRMERESRARPIQPVRRQKASQGIRGFGSLAQQAQAPIPGATGPAATPDGTSSGY